MADIKYSQKYLTDPAAAVVDDQLWMVSTPDGGGGYDTEIATSQQLAAYVVSEAVAGVYLTVAGAAAAYQPLDADLTALAGLSATGGMLARTGAGAFAVRTIAGTANRITVTDGDGVAGAPTINISASYVGQASITTLGTIGTGTWQGTAISPTYLDLSAYSTTAQIAAAYQPLDSDLSAIAGLSSTGIIARTGAGTAAVRAITQPAAGITVSNGDGVSGNPTLALANDLSALEGLGSTGFATRTASDTWAQRTMTGTANELTVANGDGVSGAPTFSIHASYTSGKWQQITSTSASGASTVDFTGFNSSLYEEYKIVFWGVNPSIDDFLAVRTSSNGGSSYDSGASDYDVIYSIRDTGYYIEARATADGGFFNQESNESSSNYPCYGELTFHSPQTAQYSAIRFDVTAFLSGSALQWRSFGNIWRTSSADVDACRFYWTTPGTTFSAGSEFRFYGRRK